ncbi:TolC family outer membrane protein [Vogesella indigofera]|uniref:TolC family outer membrane protein n=1 Tax=Vogesella indigofera TaxID=45465 RepID=UPI00234EA17B|nr:TolC family outer membrane protein [Vogesella indigofera]MDC7709696.1 TolC family outer membrane protein [Vogesella indigofera]
MQKATLGMTLFLLLATASALPAPSSPVDLYRSALRLNPSYLAAIDNRRAEDANKDVARSLLLPIVTLGAGIAKNQTKNTVSDVHSRYHYDNSNTSVTLSMPVFKKYAWAQFQQSKTQLQLADSQLASAADDLFMKICKAYFDVLLGRDRLLLIRAQKSSILMQKAAAAQKYQYGSGTRIDIDDAAAREQWVIADEIEAGGQLKSQEAALASLAGVPAGTVKPLLAIDAEHLTRQPLAYWQAQSLAANNELTGIRQQIAIAVQEIEKARAGHYPSLDFVASSSKAKNDNIYNVSNKSNNVYHARSIGLQLNVPLFSGGGIDAGVRQALAKKEQAEHLYEAARNDVQLRVATVYQDIKTGTERIRALDMAEQAAVQTVRSNQKGIEAGVKTTSDVLQAEELLYKTRLDRAAARYNLALSLVQLKLLAGTLTEDDFAYVEGMFGR